MLDYEAELAIVVGFRRDPQIFLRSGDLIEGEIEKIGILADPIIAEEA